MSKIYTTFLSVLFFWNRTVDDIRPVLSMNRQALYSSLRGNITSAEVSVFGITVESFDFEELFVELPCLVSGPLLLLFRPLREPLIKRWCERTSVTLASWRLDNIQRWMVFFSEFRSVQAVTRVSDDPPL